MTDALSSAERREIAGRARTLHERLDGPPNEPGDDPPFDPDDLLEEWRDEFPDGDAFAERLAHEGVAESAVREQLGATRWPADEPLPAWLDDLEALIAHVADHRPGERPVAAPDDTPFAELLRAVAAFGRRQLDDDLLPAAGVAGMERYLVDRLEATCVRALYVEFKSFVEHHDPELATADPTDVDDPGTELYDGFVDAMCGDGFRNLCVEYPVLARQLVALLDGWTAAVTTVCRRLRADRDALRDRFDVSGAVTAIEPLADDAHAGGRVPVRVGFESGAVVHKPRPVDAGVALYAILDRLGDHLDAPGFRSPTYLPRDDYGWMSVVAYDEPADAAAVERYYERAGVLLAVGYVLDLPDLQYENVIAAGDQPAVVDGETIFHPYVDPAATAYTTEVSAASKRSVLRSALLPWTVGEVDDDDVDVPKPVLAAGLGSSSDVTEVSEVSKPAIEAVNSDVMSVTGRSPTIDRSANTPSVDGVDQPPDEHVDAIVDGFREAYATVRDLHADGRFRSAIADPKLVAGVENRFVFRSTSGYRSTLRLSAARDPLRDGARLSVEFERLAAPFFDGRIESDRFWSLYAAERRSLLRRDVPRFASRADGTTIYHDGEPTGVEADRSGYDRCGERLGWLDDDDLRRQTWILRRCLDESPPEPEPASASPVLSDDRLRREAIAYGDAAIDAAVETEAGRRWVSLVGAELPQLCVTPAGNTLYGGRAGIGLAAAALYDRTGRERFRETAIAALDPVAADEGESSTAFGGVNGSGSLVYALSVAADLLDRPAYAERASAHARAVTPEQLADDEVLDVLDGTAGMLLALLAHYERHGGSAVRDRAVDCGERLLDERVAVDGYRAWTTGNDEPTPGLAHGVSGVAYALARLDAVVGDDRFEAAAREALAHEETAFDPARTNYAIAAETGGSRFQDRWCHGRTGCALARLGAGGALGDDGLLADANALLSATVASGLDRYDQLCCGNLGRATALLEAARRTGRPASDARAFAGRVLSRRDENGALTMPGHGDPVDNPTLFNGVSGAAYTALRLREPDALPCVLLLE